MTMSFHTCEPWRPRRADLVGNRKPRSAIFANQRIVDIFTNPKYARIGIRVSFVVAHFITRHYVINKARFRQLIFYESSKINHGLIETICRSHLHRLFSYRKPSQRRDSNTARMIIYSCHLLFLCSKKIFQFSIQPTATFCGKLIYTTSKRSNHFPRVIIECVHFYRCARAVGKSN